MYAAIRQGKARAGTAEELAARIKDGKVTLSGAISDERMIADIVRRVRAVEGVTDVKSEIQYLAFTSNLG